jgi:hypothetical protein
MRFGRPCQGVKDFAAAPQGRAAGGGDPIERYVADRVSCSEERYMLDTAPFVFYDNISEKETYSMPLTDARP